MVTMNNLGVRILLQLIFEWQLLNDSNQNQTATLSLEDGEDISKSISEALNVKPCTFCQIYIWRNKNNGISLYQSDGGFDLLINTNGNCQYEWLHRNMDEAIGKAVNVTLKDSRSISVHLHYTERPSFLSRDYLYNKMSKMCQGYVTPSEKYCPKISLTFSEVQVLQNQRAKRNLAPLFNGMYANETTILFICLSDYYKSVTLTKTSVGIQMFLDALLLSLPLLQILMSL